MSSVTKLELEIHEIYTGAFRAIRLNTFNRYVRMNMYRDLSLPKKRNAILCAFISWDNRAESFDGWLNPYRKRQFEKCKWNHRVKLHLHS